MPARPEGEGGSEKVEEEESHLVCRSSRDNACVSTVGDIEARILSNTENFESYPWL